MSNNQKIINLHHPLVEVDLKSNDVNINLDRVVVSNNDGTSSIVEVNPCDKLKKLNCDAFKIKSLINAGVPLDFVHTSVKDNDAESIVSDAIADFENDVNNFKS